MKRRRPLGIYSFWGWLNASQFFIRKLLWQRVHTLPFMCAFSDNGGAFHGEEVGTESASATIAEDGEGRQR